MTHDHAACRGQALAAVAEACAARRLRLTPARACVLEALLESHRAMTAYELLDRLAAAGLGSQPPVVYRALDFLVGNGFAHRIERLGAYRRLHRRVGRAPGRVPRLPRLPARRRDAARPRAARAGGRGGGDRLRDRAHRRRGRGALRALPGGRGVTTLIAARGRSGSRSAATRCCTGVDLAIERRRDRHRRRAERLGQEHAAAPADRRRAARTSGRVVRRAGAADRLRAAAAGGRPHAADDRRAASWRSRAAGGAAEAPALERVGIADLGGRQLAALSGGPVPAGAAGAGADCAGRSSWCWTRRRRGSTRPARRASTG